MFVFVGLFVVLLVFDCLVVLLLSLHVLFVCLFGYEPLASAANNLLGRVCLFVCLSLLVLFACLMVYSAFFLFVVLVTNH